MADQTILVTGSSGQIGSELVPRLKSKFPSARVIPTDLKPPSAPDPDFTSLDVTDQDQLEPFISDRHITIVYHLASLLSVASEDNPAVAWKVNLGSLKSILDLAVKYRFRVFWPSSIAVFGPTTPQVNTPQHTVLEPTTIYGVTKVAGELLCQYYAAKFGVDVRSVRYPGIISWRTPPSAGTTEYAVDMLRHAAARQSFSCFLSPETSLPMMYINDAVKATLDIMSADKSKLSIKTAYNLSAFSFTPRRLVTEIQSLQSFKVTYDPDFHQSIADSWPSSIDDSPARTDWNWQPEYNLPQMVAEILANLTKNK